MSTNGDKLPDMTQHNARLSLERERELGRLPDDEVPGQKPTIETDQTRAEEALASVDLEKRYNKQVVDIDSISEITTVEVSAEVIPLDPALRLAPLYTALAKAQGEFPEIPKNRVATIKQQSGGSFEFKYSDLSDLIKATRKPLTDNGLAQFQIPSADQKQCITTLAHITGVTLVGEYPIKHKDGGRMHPGQDWAISWILSRRYGLSALLGIAAEETIEVDKPTPTKDSFESTDRDGILSVRGAIVPDGATKAEKARILADAIEVQIGDAATEAGLPGVWKRNKEVIDVLQDHFSADFSNVYDCYVAREDELKA